MMTRVIRFRPWHCSARSDERAQNTAAASGLFKHAAHKFKHLAKIARATVALSRRPYICAVQVWMFPIESHNNIAHDMQRHV